MTTVDGLNLVEELVRSYGWSERFAKAAKEQYFRFLELKGRAQDFRTSNLAPSETIHKVWLSHQIWSLDYQFTCTRYGGFIHHFPLSMRDMVARKSAYAATLDAYAKVFGHEPPPLCWEPFGEPSNGVSNAAGAFKNGEASGAHIGMDHIATGEVELPVYLGGVDAALPTAPLPTALARPRKTPVSGPPKVAAVKPEKASEKVMRLKGLVLRPLAPGESRTRGRPRRSDYVRIEDLSAEDRAKVEARAPGLIAAAPSNGHLKHIVAGGGGGGAPMAVPVPGASPVLVKRGRGRPRKDGSWPIPRAFQNQMVATVAAASQGQVTSLCQTVHSARGGGHETVVASLESHPIGLQSEGHAGTGMNFHPGGHVQLQQEQRVGHGNESGEGMLAPPMSHSAIVDLGNAGGNA
jgi:hypothetical protein